MPQNTFKAQIQADKNTATEVESEQRDVPFELNEDNICRASKALKAMGHPLRLKILCVLADQELPVMEIVQQVGTTQSNVSQHIDILRAKEIVESRREGSKILCRVKDPELLNLMEAMQKTFCSVELSDPDLHHRAS